MKFFTPRYEEIRFALDVWADLPELLRLPGIEERSLDVISDVVNEAGRFATQVLAPLDVIGDREGSHLRNGHVHTPSGWQDAYQRFAEAGWNTVHFPTAVGGQGLPIPVSVAVSEMFNSANVAFCLGLMPFPGVVALLASLGTERQKALYLPALVSGRWTATLAITEPQAGTDLGALRTKAEHVDGWEHRIKGNKCFITYGDHELGDNILHFVLARSPSRKPGSKGLSLYIVPKFKVLEDGSLGGRNDVHCVALEAKIGVHASPTATMIFGEEHGATGELLGEEGHGLEHMFKVLNRARLNISVFGLASAEAAYQSAFAYAQERIQGVDCQGAPCAIIHHPDVRRMVLDMHASVDAMRAMVYYTASIAERAQHEPGEQERQKYAKLLDFLTPIVKAWVTENGFATASTGVQIAGGAGYVYESRASQYFRDARVHTIYEGTTGVQAKDLVFRKVVRDGGETAMSLLDRMYRDLEAYKDVEALRDCRPIVAQALDALRATTQWMLSLDAGEQDRREAVAVHYLNLWGTGLGAWLLMKGSVRADHGEVARSLPASFAGRKKTATHYFVAHRLLPACALKEVIMAGASSILNFDP